MQFNRGDEMSGVLNRRGGLSRRNLLGMGALMLGGLAAATLFFRSIAYRKSRDPYIEPLPGKGSIFEPRRDARLEAWEARERYGG